MLSFVVYQLISLGELQLYGEWKTKLSAKALVYLRKPDEVFNSATNAELLFSVFAFLLLFAMFCFLYNKLVYRYSHPHFNYRKPMSYVFQIAMATIIFGGIRGGYQAIPITTSQSYFSTHDILNITAVNPGYNLLFSIIDYQQINNQNIFKTIDDRTAEETVAQLHSIEKDTTVSVFKIPKPNIVIVLLESWSGDMIESLGGLKGITPEFRRLEKQGVLFTEFYATANRSQQAMSSIFAGIPGIPITTLSDHPEKYASVKSLVKVLNNNDYYTSYFFGGQLIYGNMKSFLVDNKFDLLIEQADIKDDLPSGKLGIHDEYMFDYFEKEITKMPRPFFANLFTISSHSPYDFPGERHFQDFSLEKDFVNSVYYTDKSLGSFFAKAKQSDYWDSTIFIVLADHSHNSPLNHPVQSFEYHKIPLLILGGALRDEFKNTKNNKLCSNVDITKTILKQLRIESGDFFWSKDIFNPYGPEFAYFELNDGFGWKRNFGEEVYSIKNNYNYVLKVHNNKKGQLDKEGRAYTQIWFDEFMSY
jgi:phosphoglycerol transferase MdoB-like AlkP superfamily enzyme